VINTNNIKYKDILEDMIRQVNSSSKILIVDYYTHDIIFSIFTRNELANENIECNFKFYK